VGNKGGVLGLVADGVGAFGVIGGVAEGDVGEVAKGLKDF